MTVEYPLLRNSAIIFFTAKALGIFFKITAIPVVFYSYTFLAEKAFLQ